MMTWWLSIAPLSAIWVDSMIRACWQGGMMIALVWGVGRLMPRMSPSVRCWLWRVAYLKLLLSLIGLTPVALPLLPPDNTTPATLAEITQVRSPSPSPAPLVLSPVRPRSSLPQDTRTTQPLEHASSLQSFDWGLLFACAWLAGVMLVGIRVVNAWQGSRRLQQSGIHLDGPILTSICHRLCTQLGIAVPPRLMVSEAVTSPALLGLLHPVVLLPKPLLNACTQRQYELILAHELAHMKRRDLLWQWLPTCANVLLFFHPLVWLAQREYRLAQEMACDAQVVLQPRISAAEYGHFLLAVAGGTKWCHGHSWSQSAAHLFETATAIKRRLIALARVRKPSRSRLTLHIIAMVVLSSVVLLPWRLTTQARPSERSVAVHHGGSTQTPRDVVANAATLSVETAVRTMLTAYNAADVATLAQYLLPTVMTLDAAGNQRRIDFNASMLASAFRAGFKPQVTIDDLNVGGFSHTAFVTVKLNGSLSETTGVPHTGPWRLTQKWRRQGNTWKLSFYRGFPMLPWEVEVPSRLQPVMRQYWRATMAGDATAISTLFAPEAQVIFSATPARINGRDAIQRAYAQRFHDFPTRRIDDLALDLQDRGDVFAVLYASYTIAETHRAGQTRRRKEQVTLTHVNTGGQWFIVSQHHSPRD